MSPCNPVAASVPMQVACGVGRAEAPVRHGAALPQGLDSSLQQWGVVAPGQRQALAKRLQVAAEAAMAALLATEAKLSPQQRGGTRARTDLLGECCGDSTGPQGHPTMVALTWGAECGVPIPVPRGGLFAGVRG